MSYNHNGSLEHNYRQLGLQGIIKAQQAKIYELKEQLRYANQRQEKRYDEYTKSQNYLIQEKQKMIEHLKIELQKSQITRRQDITHQTLGLQKQKYALQAQLKILKGRIVQLEHQARHHDLENQNKLKQSNQMNKKLLQQLNEAFRAKNILSIEMENMTHFYKNAIIELPKRKETLLWVKNLIEYMDRSQQKALTTQRDLSSYIKNTLESFRDQINKMVEKTYKNEFQVQTELMKVQLQIQKFVRQSKTHLSKITQDNDNFWQSIRKTKQSFYQQEIASLRQKLYQSESKYQQEIKQLTTSNKNLEIQKKTIVLGFQELRNLNQSRQKTFKEQINLLKTTIDEMTVYAQQREKEFQDQIAALGKRIQTIGQRYYENISKPSLIAKENISQQMSVIRKELENVHKDKVFQQAISSMNSKIVKLNSLIQQGGISQKIENNLKLTENIVQQVSNSITSRIRQSKHRSSIDYQLDDSVDASIRAIQFRQRQSKLVYQNSLLKKHNAKLQQVNNNLEKKNKNFKGYYNIDSGKAMELEKQILYLKAENEALKSHKNYLETEFSAEIKRYKQSVITKASEIKSDNKIVENLLQNLLNINNNISKTLVNQKTQAQEMMIALKEIVSCFTKPLQNMQALIKDYSKYQDNSLSKSAIQYMQTSKQKFVLSNYNQQYENYKNLLLKRAENVNSTQKYVNELIRTIRQISPTTTKKKQLENKQNVELDKNEKQLKNRLSQLEKRFKELQGYRIKDKQQTQNQLAKIVNNIKSIQSKISSKKSSVILKTFEQNFQKKIENILHELNNSSGMEINSIAHQSLRDLQSKLKQVLVQNEGLIKEMGILQQFEKRQKD